MHRNGVEEKEEEEETATIHDAKVDYDLCDENNVDQEEEIKQCIKLLLMDMRNDEDIEQFVSIWNQHMLPQYSL